MAATGFAMWLDNSFMNLFGKLGYDVARSVHYYEAILATLGIAVDYSAVKAPAAAKPANSEGKPEDDDEPAGGGEKPDPQD